MQRHYRLAVTLVTQGHFAFLLYERKLNLAPEVASYFPAQVQFNL